MAGRIADTVTLATVGAVLTVGGILWAGLLPLIGDAPIVPQIMVVTGPILLSYLAISEFVRWVRRTLRRRHRSPVVMTPRLANGNLYLIVSNRKQTDRFKATLIHANGIRAEALPLVLRWKNTADEYRKVPATASDAIHLLSYKFVREGDITKWSQTVFSSLSPREWPDTTDLFGVSHDSGYQASFGYHVELVGENTPSVVFRIYLRGTWFPQEGTDHPYQHQVYAEIEPNPFDGRMPNAAMDSELYP